MAARLFSSPALTGIDPWLHKLYEYPMSAVVYDESPGRSYRRTPSALNLLSHASSQASTNLKTNTEPPTIFSSPTHNSLLTPSRRILEWQLNTSPTPLPSSLELTYPDLSPPALTKDFSLSQSGTPFGYQFQDWPCCVADESPIARKSSLLDPKTSDATSDSTHGRSEGTPRTSLVDKFKAACSSSPASSDRGPMDDTGTPRSLRSGSTLTPLSSPSSSFASPALIGTLPTSITSHAPKVSTNENPFKVDRRPLPDQTSPSAGYIDISGYDRPHRYNTRSRPNENKYKAKRKREHSPAMDSQSIFDDHPKKKLRRTQRHSERIRSPSVLSAPETSQSIAERSSSQASTQILPSPRIHPQRTFPTDVPIHPQFPLFYRRFPVSSCSNSVGGSSGETSLTLGIHSTSDLRRHIDGIPNPPRDSRDLYTPRFVKGRGRTKIGLCPICVESREKGGEGKALWLGMKVSAFNYHMQYSHGISALTTLPFSPPLAFRYSDRRNPSKYERTRILEGMCHRCDRWVAVEGVKDVKVKVKEMFWWKHAATCHQGSNLPGEGDWYIENN